MGGLVVGRLLLRDTETESLRSNAGSGSSEPTGGSVGWPLKSVMSALGS